MLTRRWLLSGAAALMLKAHPAFAHGFHASFSVIEHNARTGSWEIFHRIVASDLDVVLTARTGRKDNLEGENASKLVEAYLLDSFLIGSMDGKALRPVWIGMNLQTDTLMVYQEIKNAGAMAGLVVNSQILTETNAGQINTVNVTFKGRTQSGLFKMNDPNQTFVF